jgi:predicted nucleotidyltransferase
MVGSVSSTASGTQKKLEQTVFHEKRGEILGIAERFGARNLRIFGSVVRGEAHPQSDIDLLVEFDPDRTLFDQIGLVIALRELLGCGVDVATPHTLHPLIKDQVMEESVPL